MARMLYLLLTFLTSIPAVFGNRAFTAQAPCHVVADVKEVAHPDTPVR